MKRACSPQNLLQKIRFISHKMVAHHDCEHLAASVLHELCDPDCFPVERIAFLVDNPDFDCLKGVAGIVQQNRLHNVLIWEDQNTFVHHLSDHPFHQQVRTVSWGSIARRGCSWDEALQEVAEHVSVAGPQFHTFPVKHRNQGVLVYQVIPGAEVEPDYLEAGAALLGLCPIE